VLCCEKAEGANLDGQMVMTVRKKEKQRKSQTKKQNASPEDFPDELREAIWAVVSFEKCEANHLTYTEAEQKLSELEAQKVSGLCIVTDEVAARITDKI
jgi:hypothetical protein